MFPPMVSNDTVVAEATHPEWVLLSEEGHPVFDENGNPVARDGYSVPEEGQE